MFRLIDTGSNGANLTLKAAFGLIGGGPLCVTTEICKKDALILGLINAAPYLAVCFLYVDKRPS
jgi:hypothetical protein